VVSYCDNPINATDFSNPFASQLVLSTRGADGACGTNDDGQTLVTFGSTGIPAASAVTGNYVGYLRSASTGQPSYWLKGNTDGSTLLLPIGSASSTVLAFANTATSNVYKPIQNLSDLVLYTHNGVLKGLNGRTSTPILGTLASATGPEGWKSAGFDQASAYAYLNTATASSGTGTWQVIAVSRSTQATTTIATGTGSIYSAGAVPGFVYASVISGAAASVLKISGSGGGSSTYIPASTTSVSGISTNSNGIHVIITVTTAGVASLRVIDSGGATLYSNSSAITIAIDQSQFDTESNVFVPSSFIFATPIGSTGFGGASLIRLDLATLTTRNLGVMPLGNSLGGQTTESVFALPLIGDRGFGGVPAARIASSQIQSTGSAFYTIDTSVANSLQRTTSQQR
jgi:hypothetical protein